MKKGKMFWLAVIAALVLVPTMAWAQAKTTTSTAASEPSFMIELYMGGGGASNTGLINDVNVTHPFFGVLPINFGGNGQIDPYFHGGLKFGYWFTPYGTYAIAGMPDWMKYFGFYTDFSYHKLNFSNQAGSWQLGGFINSTYLSESSGSVATWAFMFAGRYGFLQDSQVPFGRLQPYLAVGPAIFFTHQEPTVTATIPGFSNVGLNNGGKDGTNVGLAVETGLRYFFNKSISVEASFKYRMFTASNNHTGNARDPIFGVPVTYNMSSKPTFNMYSGQIGVAYHF